VRIGEELLVRSSSPNPTSRTFSIAGTLYFLSGNRGFRQMMEVSGMRIRGQLFTERLLSILLL